MGIKDRVIEQAVQVGAQRLPGQLSLPTPCRGAVMFVHGSGSSRASPRNRHVAGVLQRSGLATLLFDLLREDEAQDRAHVFDIDLLSARVLQALQWAADEPALRGQAMGLFGASTGAAAALRAAAERPAQVAAVVSRGGRCDLAGAALERVQAPTLLVIGARDPAVLRLNREALRRLPGVKRLEVVPDATHLFEEPGALDAVAHMAADWFVRHCASVRRPVLA
ncbi:MAG TPA: alpha/beta family hydrolase [Burkholderiaceae bacterium]|nr:alpha/beta family hydrolase [Burkholderiaceae bacterium]